MASPEGPMARDRPWLSWGKAEFVAESGTGVGGSEDAAVPLQSVSLGQMEFEKRMDSTDHRHVELFHMQWGLVREQIGVFARDMAAMRQEIQSLKLVDSRLEAKQAEINRNQHEVQGDVAKEAAARQREDEELARVFKQSQQAFDKEVRDRITQDADIARSMKGALEAADQERSERTLGMQSLEGQVLQQLKAQKIALEAERAERSAGNARFDRWCTDLRAALDEEAASRVVQSDDADRELRAAKHSLGLDLSELRGAVDQARLAQEQEMLKRIACQEVTGEELKRVSHTSEATKRLTESLREALDRERVELRTMSEGHAASTASSIERLEAVMNQEISRLVAEAEQNSSAVRAAAADAVARNLSVERSARELDQQTLRERLDDLERRLVGEITQAVCDHEESRSRLHDFIASASARESEARETLQSTVRERLAAECVAREEHRDAVFATLDATSMRIQEQAERHAGELHASLMSVREDVSQQTGALEASLETLGSEIARVSGDGEEIRATLASHDARQTNVQDQLLRLQESLSDLEHSLRDEAARSAGEHRAETVALRGLIVETKAEHDTRHAAYQLSHQEQSRCERLAREAHSAEFKQDIGRVSEEQQARHNTVHDLIAASSASLEGRLQDFALKGKDHRESLSDSLKVIEARLREEVARMSSELHAGHSSLREHTTEIESALQDSLLKEASAHAEHCQALQSSIEGVSSALRSELAQVKNDQLSAQAATSMMLAEHRSDVSSVVASHRQQRDSEHSELASCQQALDDHLREVLAHVDQEGHGRHCSIQSQLMEHQSAVEGSLAQLKGHVQEGHAHRDAGFGELRDLMVEACAKERDHVQGMFTREQEHRAVHLKTVQEHLLQEKAAQDMHTESLRAYLAQDKATRDCVQADSSERLEALERSLQSQNDAAMRRLDLLESKQCPGGPVPRPEFESEARRIWEVIGSSRYAPKPQNGEAPVGSHLSSSSSAPPRAISVEPALATACRDHARRDPLPTATAMQERMPYQPQRAMQRSQPLLPGGLRSGTATPPPAAPRPKSPCAGSALRSSTPGPMTRSQQQMSVSVSVPASPATPPLAPQQQLLQPSRLLGGSASAGSLSLHLQQGSLDAGSPEDFEWAVATGRPGVGPRPGMMQQYGGAMLAR